MNPAKRAILKQSKKGDEKIKKRLSFAPNLGTSDDSEDGVEGDIESDAVSPLSTKSVQEIHPKNLQQRFDETAQSERDSQESDEGISPVFRQSRRSYGKSQGADSSNVAADDSSLFCPNIKKTNWGLCYVRKARVREVTETDPGKRKSKVPVVAFKDNNRPEFVNQMNLGKNTSLKILIVGDHADGDGIVSFLKGIAVNMKISAEITLSCNPQGNDINGTHYYIFLVPMERIISPKTLSSVIPKLEEKTACVNLISCILLLPSLPHISCDSLCPSDLTNLITKFQINCYTWPQENDKVIEFCCQLLHMAENARGGTLGTSNLINWGLQRISIADESDM